MSIRILRACVACLLLAGCGGGGAGGGGNEGNVPPPAAPTLAVSFGYKTFHFTWSAVPTATSYRLSEDPDGVSGYAVVASGILVNNYDLALASLFGRINAKYQLEACNSGGCTASVALNMPDNLSTALGAYVKASNTGAGDGFGQAVALSSDGNTLAVSGFSEDGAGTGVTAGAPDNTATGDAASNAGAVYVFFRNGTWSQQAYIKASNTGAGDGFGTSISLSADGNTLVVGAPFEASNGSSQADNSAAMAGAAYVFTRSGTTWTQVAYLKAFNTEANDLFGFSVAVSGDGGTIAVGAIGEDGSATSVIGADDNNASNAGAVYVYFLTFPSTWNLQAYVKASNAGAGDDFGTSVSLSGDGNMLAVGAPLEASALTGVLTTSPNDATTGNTAANAGAVYTFKRASNTWSQHTYVKASNAEAGDRFGTVVVLSSDAKTLAVGAPREPSSAVGVSSLGPTPGSNVAAPIAGAAYVFNRILSGADSWAQQAYIKASNTATNYEFGVCIALSADGNTLAVGAADASGVAGIIPGSPDAAATGTAAVGIGAVYRFTRSGTVWQQQAYVKATNPNQSDGFGITQFSGGAIALSVDGSTLAVGATGESSNATGINGNQADNSFATAGAVYLY